MQMNQPGKSFKRSEDKNRIQTESQKPKELFNNKMKFCKNKGTLYLGSLIYLYKIRASHLGSSYIYEGLS